MAFKTVGGLNGKVYIPEPCAEGIRKYACKDCYACQLCSDDRCNMCRGEQKSCGCQKDGKP